MVENPVRRALVLGDGSWGTTLALILAKKGIETCLWSAFPAQASEMEAARENVRFLPGVPFPDALTVFVRHAHVVLTGEEPVGGHGHDLATAGHRRDTNAVAVVQGNGHRCIRRIRIAGERGDQGVDVLVQLEPEPILVERIEYEPVDAHADGTQIDRLGRGIVRLS